MDRQEIIQELKNLMTDYLKAQGLELIELIYRYEGKDSVLRILVDKPEGGITLDECTHLNSELSRILDEKNILQQRYILEVSSPGLDRSLLTERDFLRCINKNVRFFFSESIDGKREIQGIVRKAEKDLVYIDIDGKQFEIPLSKITKAKQII